MCLTVFNEDLLPPGMKVGKREDNNDESSFIQMALSITKHLVAQWTFNNQMEEKEVDKRDEEKKGEGLKSQLQVLPLGRLLVLASLRKKGKHENSEALIFSICLVISAEDKKRQVKKKDPVSCTTHPLHAHSHQVLLSFLYWVLLHVAGQKVSKI